MVERGERGEGVGRKNKRKKRQRPSSSCRLVHRSALFGRHKPTCPGRPTPRQARFPAPAFDLPRRVTDTWRWQLPGVPPPFQPSPRLSTARLPHHCHQPEGQQQQRRSAAMKSHRARPGQTANTSASSLSLCLSPESRLYFVLLDATVASDDDKSPANQL